MAKPMTVKRILKIFGGLVLFFTLPTLILFGVLYLKYHEDLPQGSEGMAADRLAHTMLKALNADAYEDTDYLEWSFSGGHHYKWYKTKKICHVSWDRMRVVLDLQQPDQSKVFAGEQAYYGAEMLEYISKAQAYFNNDSFWLVAPFKVFDPGVERRLVKTKSGEEALLVTYTTGGTTPGDSYLWHFDATGKPKSFQMWVRILPLKGLEASWNSWMTTQSGALLPRHHKILVMDLNMGEVKGLRH